MAINLLLSAIGRIDPAVQPRLALQAGHNLAKNALDLGQPDRAMESVLRLERNYELFADTKLSLQRDWLLASIARARGHLSEAELRLYALRSGFEEHGMRLEVADVWLEMAMLASARGQPSTAEHLAARASRVMTAVGAPYAARAATCQFRRQS